MFAKNSRYINLQDTVTVDAQGRSLPSRMLRLLPEVSGQFQHTIEDVDRLDHLAYKYYRKPQKWWRICDANPEFLSPQELLGKEPIVTERFPLALKDEAGAAPWSELRRILEAKVGILDIQVVEEWSLWPPIPVTGEPPDHGGREHVERAVMVTFNTMNISLPALATAIEDSGFTVRQPTRIERLGKPIVIPPDTVG